MFIRIKTNSLIFVFLFFLIISCDSGRIFEENREISNGKWVEKEKIYFKVNIPDTTRSYNVYLNIRNAMDYPYSNLFIFLDTRFPDGHISRDTLECLLADYDGRWLGSGIGSIKFNQFLLQKGIYFRQKGTYIFEFQHAMRVHELIGIQDIGLRIEK